MRPRRRCGLPPPGVRSREGKYAITPDALPVPPWLLTGTLADLDETPSSIILLDVRPQIDGGRYPVKREVGDRLTVSADIFKDGHDKLSAVLQYRAWDDDTWSETDMCIVDNDRWEGSVILDRNTRYRYRVVAFPNALDTWLDELAKKFAAGLDVSLELHEGELILERMAARSDAAKDSMEPALARLRASIEPAAAVALLTDAGTAADLRPWVVRDHAQVSTELEVIVDRVAARSAAWYSLFPRSQGRIFGESGTFDDVIARLPAIADMGFDVLYLLPIHPIALTNRKGKNNAVTAAPGDPGVPYAIGNAAGGHDAIEPSLGTIDDFDRLVTAAGNLGMEIALDVAIQASPDHPWATAHPDWFTIRPDGTIKFAENPPKKYEDIYPVNFATAAWRPLWEEILRVITFWVDHGVRSFRVDNPHTKPVVFWEWLIRKVHRDHPEVVFLSEAFTRPKMMAVLAKAGFAQSYTYFTWRNFKQEIVDYALELTSTDKAEYMRGNFFPNTHDILPIYLQTGGRPAFQTRLVLAATLSSVYGIYSGFELCENTSVAGKEEYLDSEKYELKVWDWGRPGNIIADVTAINTARRAHRALQEYDNLRFYGADDDRVLCYAKVTPDREDRVVAIVSLDPHQLVTTSVHLDLSDLYLLYDPWISVTDLVTGERWTWTGAHHQITLDPSVAPYLLLSLSPS